MKRTLGTCYYPEHWPEEMWEADARRMVDTGLTWVRIGEFAWSRLEPSPGDLKFDWLDRAIDVLGRSELKVVLGTPTATPPRWLVAKHPDMLALDALGHPRSFGSRRHYCFSHEGYRAESDRIVTLFAERYGNNPHVAAWQTDNEYGCHDTTLSYSGAARTAFRRWLQARYGSIEALNRSWGNVFWSMEYSSFDEIDLPNLTVTEPNPSHALAFRRFSSDQVASFNKRQTDIIRAYSDAPIGHNFMGRITDFDHFKVGDDLDIATWDSYPLGFLEDRVGSDDAHQRTFARQGDPDFQAFHHDLYRAVGKGRWWVMEQQPGPVNWAPYNPAPLPGMMRLWAWEAFAHGAEAVCYFRWRQAPFAQEQMHAGMLRPDNADAPAITEAKQVADELRGNAEVSAGQSDIALIFDYDADFTWATQPHGAGLNYFQIVFDVYKALRKLGLSIDIVRADARDFSGYKIVLAPGLIYMPQDLKSALSDTEVHVVLGPRTAARTADMVIPVPLPPDFPGLDVTVSRVESVRPDMPMPLKGGGSFVGYREELEGSAEIILELEDGRPAAMRSETTTYVGGKCDEAAWTRLLKNLCIEAGLSTMSLTAGVRCREAGNLRIWTNYGSEPAETPAGTIEAAGVLFEEL